MLGLNAGWKVCATITRKEKAGNWSLLKDMKDKFSFSHLMPGVYAPGDSVLHKAPINWKIFFGLGLLSLTAFGKWMGIAAVFCYALLDYFWRGSAFARFISVYGLSSGSSCFWEYSRSFLLRGRLLKSWRVIRLG